MLTVIPAYGRDYKSAKDAKADWAAGKDFMIATYGPDDGRYCNKADMAGQAVMIRYKRLTQICRSDLSEEFYPVTRRRSI